MRGQCRRRHCKYLHALNEGDGFRPYNPPTYHQDHVNGEYSHPVYGNAADGGYGQVCSR